MPSLLRSLLDDPTPPPFAVLNRAEAPGVEVLVGDVVDVATLADIPQPAPYVLAAVPYRQVVEQGFACHDDGAPLRCLVVREVEVLALEDVLATLPDVAVQVRGGGFDVDDTTYAGIVTRVINDEIGRGEGANFVIRRDFVGDVGGAAPRSALALLRRLLVNERGAYWTFALHAGDVTMVGATPERHVSVTGGQVLMNPISGTYRYPSGGATREGLLDFLGDLKETEELLMVVDEELKMMSRICSRGGRVIGPRLKEMGALAHTEYVLEGSTDLDVREVLHETMFAPTVTGSPVHNATRVIARYESTGRGYYAGALALLGHDEHGRQSLDAPILIRTAYLDGTGGVRVPVGATLVRHSVPENEVAETYAKAAGVLRALGVGTEPYVPQQIRLTDQAGVGEALAARNASLAEFWLRPQHDRPHPDLVGRSALVVDAEDSWTAMVAHMLRRLGMTATVRRWDEVDDAESFDLLVGGPGPGDPRNRHDPRIARLRELLGQRLAAGTPLLAVCLSHQVLAGLLGLPLAPLPAPYQGTQRVVDLFGRRVRVGFYNTFTVMRRPGDPVGAVQVACAGDTDEVHALRGKGYASVQFHAESLLSPDGFDVLAALVVGVLHHQQVRAG
ncbi:MAG: chorismate-binding protein [Actinomycetota bacterium]|nr:chorismate-binding protein [Actinomycetota bacterium]